MGIIITLSIFLALRFIFCPRIVWKFYINILLSFDQLINAILLGDPDESISGRLGRAIKSKKPKFFVKPTAFFVDYMAWFLSKEKNHVINSIEPEESYNRELWSWIKEN